MTASDKPATPEVSDSAAQVSTDESRRKRTPRGSHVGDLSDAAVGTKTAKSGKTESFYGYDLHALVRVASGRAGSSPDEPQVIEALRLTPAGKDVVKPSLELIDTVLNSGQQINYLLVDKHYHYKRYGRWLVPLIKRGIKQVHDLREDEIGFLDWDGALMAAGVPHCPGTPSRLGEIAPLGLPPSKEASEETWAAYMSKKAAFEKDIEEREAYAATRHAPLDADGRSRWICPAVSGKCGCPLREGTVRTAMDADRPIVASPPKPDEAPAMCRQQVFTLHVTTAKQEQVMKLYQDTYWGSPKHRANYSRRTHVEGFFGVLKGGNSSGKDREGSLYTGLAHESLDATMFAVVSNVRLVRSWHEDTGLGEPESPLLYVERTDTISANLTIEEHHQLDAIRKSSNQEAA